MPTPRNYYPVLLYEDISKFADYPVSVATGDTFDSLTWTISSFRNTLSPRLWDLNWRGISDDPGMILVGPPVTSRLTLKVSLIFTQRVSGVDHVYVLRDEYVPITYLKPNWRSLADVNTKTKSELHVVDWVDVVKLVGTDPGSLAAKNTAGVYVLGFVAHLVKLRLFATLVAGPVQVGTDVRPHDYDSALNNVHWSTCPEDAYLSPQVMSGLHYAGFPPQMTYGAVLDAGPIPPIFHGSRYGFFVVDPAVCNWMRLGWLWGTTEQDFRCVNSGLDKSVDPITMVPHLIHPPLASGFRQVHFPIGGLIYAINPWALEVDVPNVDPKGDGFGSRAIGAYYDGTLARVDTALRLWGGLFDGMPPARNLLSSGTTILFNGVQLLFNTDVSGLNNAFQVHGLLT